MRIIWVCLLAALAINTIHAQTATVVGTLKGNDGEVLVGASVGIEGTGIGVTTNDKGKYTLVVPAGKITVMYTYIGYKRVKKKMELNANEAIKLDILMETEDLQAVEIVDNISHSEVAGMVIQPKDIEKYPSTTGSLEQVLQYLAPGVSAGPGGELTSQYSVRGGNYDENLVYVNGFEVYRPFLVRTGQQEGLSFPNTQLIKGFTFNTGGFSAMYGDKMSSVLDIRYKRPTTIGGSAEMSLLGGAAHLEGAIIKPKDRGLTLTNPERFTWLAGVRYKTTSYLLNSLQLQGEYVPTFLDFQGDMTYDVSKRVQLEVLGNYNLAKYKLIPQSLNSTTGLFNYALQLLAGFDGSEKDDFTTSMVGAAVTWQPKENLNYRWMLSNFNTQEKEQTDITSSYRLNQVETSLGSENYGQVVGTLGYGETQNYIRNELNANVTTLAWTGSWEKSSDKLYRSKDKSLQNRRTTHFLQWGAKGQYEKISDKNKEWERQDSLGYTLPFDTSRNIQIVFPHLIKNNIDLVSQRYNAFVQDTWSINDDKKELKINAGIRASWWDMNRELTVTPRIQLYYSPRLKQDSTRKLTGVTWKVATGMYYQPPFYRELRNLEGQVNTHVLAQKSIHVLGGVAFDFKMLNRKFKFLTEAYGKYLWDLVPYDINNVQVRYYGANRAKGYVTGIDFRLNGELVKDAESWINLSFMRAREHFTDTVHVRQDVGETVAHSVYDVPRPTDQFMILSMYFQDYLPNAKWASVHMALTVGTGLPFGIPDHNTVNRNAFRYSPYHRIDIGFSFSLWNKELWTGKQRRGEVVKDPGAFIKKFQKLWMSVEVFNLMEVANTASNTWVKDFYNYYYAIPNRLTSRRVNLRFVANF